jgi:uroporphyrinogen III methyltransferase/synthase
MEPVSCLIPVNSLPLTGRTIVITRALAQADEFAQELERYGAQVIACPTIEIQELDDYQRLDEAINHLYGYDWLILTSVNAVNYFFKRLTALGRDAASLDELKVCVIGEATAERLGDLNVHVDVIPNDFKAEGVFSALERFIGGPDAFKGLNILLPRASVARDFLPKALEEAGARVDIVPVYRTALPDNLDRGRVTALLSGSADCIAFTSASTVKNLAQLFDTQDLGPVLSGITIACLGDITSQAAVDFGLNVEIQPEQTTIPALARAIADYFATK